MPCPVQFPHHGLEFADLLPVIAGTRISRLGRKEIHRVVAPIIAQALVEQMLVIEEVVDGHELHGGDAELLEVLDHRAELTSPHRCRESLRGPPGAAP